MLVEERGEIERERARVERLLIDSDALNARLSRENDRLRVDLAERGKVNADLNKRLQRAERMLNKVAGIRLVGDAC